LGAMLFGTAETGAAVTGEYDVMIHRHFVPVRTYEALPLPCYR
jgi:hypothetical protein